MTSETCVIANKTFAILLPLAILSATLLIGLVIRKVVFMRLIRWSKNTKTKIDDVIIESVKGPLIIWFFMVGLYLAVGSSELPEKLTLIINKILLILGLFSATFVLAGISGKAIKIYSAKIESTLPVTSLTQNISRIIIFGVGLLIILSSLGISITPILATLGVGGLAVALALQDTLSNLFAGFHIIVSKQIRIGDYVKLESGEEGYVADITWRTTKIKMLPNNMILVPNEKLNKAIVTNYYLPDREGIIVPYPTRTLQYERRGEDGPI